MMDAVRSINEKTILIVLLLTEKYSSRKHTGAPSVLVYKRECHT